jgi:hypothetical protein
MDFPGSPKMHGLLHIGNVGAADVRVAPPDVVLA